MVVQPELAGSPPVTEWKPETIAVGGVHHAVYAIVAGLVYDALDQGFDVN